jgi:site-specific recombinase XerD
MIMNGCDPMTLVKLMGHSEIQTTMRYAHLAPDFARQAIGRLDLTGTNPA